VTGESTKADFYVSTNGDDAWSGNLPAPNAARTDGPFATLARARDAVRDLKGGAKRDFVVLIRGGTYYLKETVVFGLQDSAQEGCSVTYGAYSGEEPVFSSGVKIRGWRELGKDRPDALSEKAKAKVWVADVPSSLGRFYTLYDGDRRLPRACSAGFAPTEPPLPHGDPLRDMLRDGDAKLHSLAFPKDALRAWPNLEDVEIIVIPGVPFTINILGLESVDEHSCVARTLIEGTWDFRQIRVGTTPEGQAVTARESVWVENVLEALDTPGEWVLNTREGKLYLWPTGDSPGDCILAPCLRELIRVEGDVDIEGPTDIPVRGLVFRDLTFTQGDRGVWTKDDAAIQHDWEMIDKDDALVRLRGAEECAVESCKFFNSGASAVRLDLHCQRNRVIGSEINHLGGAGILLIGYGPGTKDANKQNEVVNNHIHHCGEIYWHSHGIVVWQSGENRIENNYIHHMPRKGICLSGVRPWFFDAAERALNRRECARSIRWHEIENAEEVQQCGARIGWDRDPKVTRWDPVMPYLHTRDNVVENNEVYRVGAILGDGAAINITATGEGNIIRRNYIHDIFNEHLHGAFRTDDFQRGTLIAENVIFGTNSCGLCLRHENYVINNVVVDARPGRYVWIGPRPFDGAKIVRNIFFDPSGGTRFYVGGRGGDPLKWLGKMKSGEVDRNIYFAANAPGADDVIVELQKVGHEKNGVYADPLFVDWENGDFRLRPDSPALKIGIKSIDLSNVGLTDSFPKRFK